MAPIFLMIAAVLACVSYTSFSAAANIAHAAASNWALHICTQSPLICKYPSQMAYAAVVMVVLALVTTFLSFVRNRHQDNATPAIDRIINLRPRR